MDKNKYDCSGRRVLVVEDNEINREITCEFLKYLEIKVVTASSGCEALRLFEESEPKYFDGILMDIKMPAFDGYETSAAIRRSAHPDAKRVCIIAMTADNFAEEHQSIDSGMNFHITKPIDIDYFCSMLHNAFEEK
jgi:CheY-like chemotaxis protein